MRKTDLATAARRWKDDCALPMKFVILVILLLLATIAAMTAFFILEQQKTKKSIDELRRELEQLRIKTEPLPGERPAPAGGTSHRIALPGSPPSYL